MESEYKILSLIGEGHFSQVFKAKHKTSEIIVALKKIYPQRRRHGEPIHDFKREADVLQDLCHPNVNISTFLFFAFFIIFSD